ncbi:MAG: hypothetical protein AB8H79_07345 [Myxococcota bacterium]
MRWTLMVLAMATLASPATADETTTENCGQLWADYFNRVHAPEPGTSGSTLFRLADKVGSLGRKKAPEVIVASCKAGPPNTSTIDVWAGQREFDVAGNPIVKGTCTTVDVIEIQGKKRNRCRRFPTSRICRQLDDPSVFEIAVGGSSIVECPE